ncbi:josephin-2-like [Mizuhopecten yessoensis]|uniref:Josephin-2 n=1 Tax=Mizuhopecten yessoensis TaxID=6573 RepID=A0A210QVJ0_MIZYE|nr:josephin-2-like [Mizuhopecten yessoensis]OWF52734.1 Josephin-1 [Mizuhopecten yessoensis]
MDNSKQAKSDVYHERQVKELCALHALNNLYQDKKAFSKKDLDEVCIRLSPDHFINPHRSVLGFGNYDVNVIMAAVQKKNCETLWFDKRKDIKCLIPENIFGFILNTPTDYKWGMLRLPFKRKHWIAFRKIGDVYYNLDSKLDTPQVIGDEKILLGFLRQELEDEEKELLLVVHQDVERKGTWRKATSEEKKSRRSSASKGKRSSESATPTHSGSQNTPKHLASPREDVVQPFQCNSASTSENPTSSHTNTTPHLQSLHDL